MIIWFFLLHSTEPPNILDLYQVIFFYGFYHGKSPSFTTTIWDSTCLLVPHMFLAKIQQNLWISNPKILWETPPFSKRSHRDSTFKTYFLVFFLTLRILNPPMETPDPPFMTPRKGLKTGGNLTPKMTSQGFLGHTFFSRKSQAVASEANGFLESIDRLDSRRGRWTGS